MPEENAAEGLIEEIEQIGKKKKFVKWYNKNYRLLLLLPAIALLLSIAYLAYFTSVNGDFITKDISLTGGVSVTVFPSEEINLNELKIFLAGKIEDFSIRELTDFRSGAQVAVVIESTIEPSRAEELRADLEEFIGYELNEENSSIESTGSSLSSDFYHQLIYAIILSFSFMAAVVLFIFGGKWKIKMLTIFLTLIPVILFFSGIIGINNAIIANSVILVINLVIYIRTSIPSAAVIISAFADIVMTLAVVNLFGITMSSAGIVAFLMLIGYSVDSDIMLTTRLLKRHESTNHKLGQAFKTGITMTLTSIVAISVALIITQSFSPVLKQIFTILLIGLAFDIPNTWITNASILKWYLDSKERRE